MILVVNAGSSSLKLAAFRRADNPVAAGAVSEIGTDAQITTGAASRPVVAGDHAAALLVLLEALRRDGIALREFTVSGHRIVHGGRELTSTARITPRVRAEIEACGALAPLHNPPALSAIDALAAICPDLPQFACFDTAFHATNPEIALRYALPESRETAGLRRYGFHGISYSGLVARLPELSGASLPRRLLALHLGNGASLCAIREGRSVATTMGYSPLDGLTMGTRAGSIDGNAVLDLARHVGIDRAGEILNRESGLLGLSGNSDMRALRQDSSRAADFAIGHFCYWAARHAGSMIVAMGGINAIAFTGGIGENDARMRSEIAAALGFLGLRLDPEANAVDRTRLHAAESGIDAWIVPAREEATIAADVRRMLGG